MRRGALFARSLALVATVSAVALAAGPVLHEYVAPDPKEDLQLGSTTAAGGLPAALQTPSGVVPAPDTTRPPSASDHAYGSSAPAGGSTFYPDRDTRRPDAVNYDDPFSPAITPFKRMTAFDAVNPDYGFRVYDTTLKEIPVGGTASATEDPFFGDITVDVTPGDAVRIPSVAPGTRLLKVHTVPPMPVKLLKDGAENWFVRAGSRARIRLLVEVAAPRAAFGGPLPEGRWADMPELPTLAPSIKRAAEEVNRSIGVSRSLGVRDAIGKLVAYYRSFTESNEPLASKGDIYVDLALSKKGVCRHRAFAFAISALAIGLPTRLLTNEAHAWVEVFDGVQWRRIDLGGAASEFDDPAAAGRVPHTPPPDPFSWPKNAGSAQEVADAGRAASGPGTASSASPPSSGAPTTSSPTAAGAASGTSASRSAPDDSDLRPHAAITVRAPESAVFRNQPLHLQGRVAASGDACPNLRLDVVVIGGGAEQEIGSLATDEAGAFDGAVVVPATLAVGAYEVIVTTPGDARCGAGRSESSPLKQP